MKRCPSLRRSNGEKIGVRDAGCYLVSDDSPPDPDAITQRKSDARPKSRTKDRAARTDGYRAHKADVKVSEKRGARRVDKWIAPLRDNTGKFPAMLPRTFD